MKAHSLIILAALMTVLWSCDDDDKLPIARKPSEVGSSNKNANPTNVSSDYGRMEFPRLKGDANSVVLVRRVQNYGINYAIEYDTEKRSQRWTCWQWYRGNSGTGWNRNNWDSQTDNEWAMLNMRTHGWGDPFQPDPDLPVGQRTELNEYDGIPYQRGHICASADRLNSKDANEQTFYLSNIMPQSSQLNNGIWQDMENKMREWGKSDTFRRTLYVVKGGTIDDANIRTTTATGLVVPKYFFMAALCEDNQGGYKAMAFRVEHTSSNEKGKPLRNYVVNVRTLEQLTGIDFFCNLPDDTEEEVETAAVSKIVSDWALQ